LTGVAGEFFWGAGDASLTEVTDAVAEFDGLGFGGHGADFFEKKAITEGVDFVFGETGSFFGGGFDASEFSDDLSDARPEERVDFFWRGVGVFEGVVEKGDAVEFLIFDAAGVDENVQNIQGVSNIWDWDLSIAVVAGMAFGGKEGGAMDNAHDKC